MSSFDAVMSAVIFIALMFYGLSVMFGKNTENRRDTLIGYMGIVLALVFINSEINYSRIEKIQAQQCTTQDGGL